MEKRQTIAERQKKVTSTKRKATKRLVKNNIDELKVKKAIGMSVRKKINKLKDEIRKVNSGAVAKEKLQRFADKFAKGKLDLSVKQQNRLAKDIINSTTLERYNMSPKRTMEEYFYIALANMADYVDWDNDGRMYLKSKDELTREQTAAIREINTRRDSATGRYFVVKFKFHDKLQALDSIAKHFGLFEKDNLQKAPSLDVEKIITSLPPELTDLVRTKLIKEMSKYGNESDEGMGLSSKEYYSVN